MRYKLIPYIYAQAKDCSEKGLPMVRALFVEYPNDPGAWLIEDEYLFGSDMLVAPLFQDSVYERDVYLPGGQWIDYQDGKIYNNGWHHIQSGKIPAIILVRNGAVIPHAKVAQSTKDIDWNKILLMVYSTNGIAKGLVFRPSDNEVQELNIVSRNGKFILATDPYDKKVEWTITESNK
jgi:alpha-D-xyloside xylohydrolase